MEHFAGEQIPALPAHTAIVPVLPASHTHVIRLFFPAMS